MLLIDLPQTPPTPDLGVIRQARRRRRRRVAAAAAAIAALLAGALLLSARGGVLATRAPQLQPSSSPTPLSGPPLPARTHLRLIIAATGVAAVVDVDRARVTLVRGLGVSPHSRYLPRAPSVSLSAAPGGALAVVERQACARCSRQQALFSLAADGAVRRLGALALGPGASTTPQLGKAAEWVLERRAAGGCTLRAQPALGPALSVPCGTLDGDTALGLPIATAAGTVFVDPASGRVLGLLGRRARDAGQFAPLPGDLALESSGNPDPSGLALVDVATGARTPLRWPSAVRYGYWTVAQPGGALVAVTFIDPYSAASRAPLVDLWVLDTRTATFTHVPGFPATEDFKQSDVAWAPGGRLVIASQRSSSAVVAIWTPGERLLRVHSLPRAGGGYYGFIPVFAEASPAPQRTSSTATRARRDTPSASAAAATAAATPTTTSRLNTLGTM